MTEGASYGPGEENEGPPERAEENGWRAETAGLPEKRRPSAISINLEKERRESDEDRHCHGGFLWNEMCIRDRCDMAAGLIDLDGRDGRGDLLDQRQSLFPVALVGTRHLSGITKANIATRNFPLSVAELRKRDRKSVV